MYKRQRALLLGSARADVGQIIGALQVLAMGLTETGDRTNAIQILRTAANLIEQVSIGDLDAEVRATFLATQHGVFEELTDALVADAQPTACLLYTRLVMLRDLAVGTWRDPPNGLDPEANALLEAPEGTALLFLDEES